MNAARSQPENQNPHSELCGMAPETDCPACLARFAPLYAAEAMEKQLERLGIDSTVLYDRVLSSIRGSLDELIAERCAEPLRVVQLTLWDFFEDEAYAEELRERLRDLLVTDMIEIAEMVYAKKERLARKVRRRSSKAR